MSSKIIINIQVFPEAAQVEHQQQEDGNVEIDQDSNALPPAPPTMESALEESAAFAPIYDSEELREEGIPELPPGEDSAGFSPIEDFSLEEAVEDLPPEPSQDT